MPELVIILMAMYDEYRHKEKGPWQMDTTSNEEDT